MQSEEFESLTTTDFPNIIAALQMKFNCIVKYKLCWIYTDHKKLFQ
jgi:hypothetical protein